MVDSRVALRSEAENRQDVVIVPENAGRKYRQISTTISIATGKKPTDFHDAQ